MKNEENQADVSLLEIQQMTVNNAVRQQENRQAIAQLRLDHDRDVQQICDAASEKEREHERHMSELRERWKRDEEWFAEMRRSQAETDRMQKETDRIIKETDRIIKETAQQMKETDKKIKELSTRFSSTTGHIIEGLMSSSAIKIYEDKGFVINSLCKNYKRKNKQLNLEMEQDVVLFTDTQVIVEEVKASCDKKDVEKFFRNMEMFKLLYDEYKDKEVFGAVAAVNYEDGADQYAHELGLFVVRVASDEIFTLDPFKLDELKRF